MHGEVCVCSREGSCGCLVRRAATPQSSIQRHRLFSRYWSPTMTINHAGQDYRMKVRDMSRNLKLTFIWRFNGFKPKDTEIDTSRFGTGK